MRFSKTILNSSLLVLGGYHALNYVFTFFRTLPQSSLFVNSKNALETGVQNAQVGFVNTMQTLQNLPQAAQNGLGNVQTDMQSAPSNLLAHLDDNALVFMLGLLGFIFVVRQVMKQN